MNSHLNTEMKTQNIASIACSQATNMTKTVNSQDTIGLTTGRLQPSCRQTILSLQTALQHTKITGPIMKLNPLTFGVSEREPSSGSTSNFPAKFIISANGAPLLQQSSEQDYMKGRIQKENCSFILGTVAPKSTITVNDIVQPASSSCQDSSEQESSKGFVRISMPSLCEQQEITGNGFPCVTDATDVLQIKESTSKSTIPIRISTRPILSQTSQRVMITTPQPSCPVLRAGSSRMKVVPSSAAHLQILSNDGKFQYVKLVTVPKDGTMIATDVTSKTLKLLVPPPDALPSNPVSATHSSASIAKQDKRRPLQRLILPANYQLKSTKTDSHAATSVAETLGLKPNETFCMVQTESDQLSAKSMKLESEIVSVQDSIQPKSAAIVSTALGTAQKLHRPCSCSKSSCLKLYCECFATGEFCDNCNCSHCLNNQENENHRQRAIRSCLSRNPLAFHPKIGKSHESEVGRQHSRGCNCKRSGCLKNYCECYEAKIPCTEVCRCHGCKNCETDANQKSLMYLANAAEGRVLQRLAASTRLDSHLDDLLHKSTEECVSEHLPHTFLTGHVVDTIGECLLEVVERWECEKAKKWEEETAGDAEEATVVNLLLEEFGRCANKLISMAGMSDI